MEKSDLEKLIKESVIGTVYNEIMKHEDLVYSVTGYEQLVRLVERGDLAEDSLPLFFKIALRKQVLTADEPHRYLGNGRLLIQYDCAEQYDTAIAVLAKRSTGQIIARISDQDTSRASIPCELVPGKGGGDWEETFPKLHYGGSESVETAEEKFFRLKSCIKDCQDGRIMHAWYASMIGKGLEWYMGFGKAYDEKVLTVFWAGQSAVSHAEMVEIVHDLADQGIKARFTVETGIERAYVSNECIVRK